MVKALHQSHLNPITGQRREKALPGTGQIEKKELGDGHERKAGIN